MIHTSTMSSDPININLPLSNSYAAFNYPTNMRPSKTNPLASLSIANSRSNSLSNSPSSSSPLANDLLKYSYSYSYPNTTASSNSSFSSSSIPIPAPKLPSISTLLSNQLPASSPANPGSHSSSKPMGVSPPVLRHNNSFSITTANNRSESMSSLDSLSKHPSVLYSNPLNTPPASSLDTLTNVAQKSFGSYSLPKNTFSNSQYLSNFEHPPASVHSFPSAPLPAATPSSLPYSTSYNNNPYSSTSSAYNSNSNSPSIPKYQSKLSSLNYNQQFDDLNNTSTESQLTDDFSKALQSQSPSSPHSSSNPLHSNISSKFKKKRSNLPKQSTSILLNWLHHNLAHPYPNSKEKIELMRKTGLTAQQLSNWFINARRRKIHVLKESKSK